MKGVIKETPAGWYIMYPPEAVDGVVPPWETIPVHPSDVTYFTMWDGKVMEFEIVKVNLGPGTGAVNYAKLITTKEQTNGERFEEFMRTVEGYPELEGTMNLCEDIIEKKTGKMTEEEWQAAERAQTPRMYSEEEVIRILDKREDYLGTEPSIFDYLTNKKWFEQFKIK
jgi:hypothetical protein